MITGFALLAALSSGSRPCPQDPAAPATREQDSMIRRYITWRNRNTNNRLRHMVNTQT
jgi:hypothetical protein